MEKIGIFDKYFINPEPFIYLDIRKILNLLWKKNKGYILFLQLNLSNIFEQKLQEKIRKLKVSKFRKFCVNLHFSPFLVT